MQFYDSPILARRLAASLCLALTVVAQVAAATVDVVDQHGAPLANAVVTALATQVVAQATPSDATIAQQHQQFLPRVTAIRTGTLVHFPNRDITQHHVYSFSDAKAFEIKLYKGDSPDPIQFNQAGIVALGCNIHDWMLGYVYITNDDYYAVSDDQGRVELPAPVDDLQSLTVWHPAALSAEPRTIAANALTIAADGTINVAIETSDEDPLAFEIDPLQMLFQEVAQ